MGQIASVFVLLTKSHLALMKAVPPFESVSVLGCARVFARAGVVPRIIETVYGKLL